jgi:hypothetical protein
VMLRERASCGGGKEGKVGRGGGGIVGEWIGGARYRALDACLPPALLASICGEVDGGVAMVAQLRAPPHAVVVDSGAEGRAGAGEAREGVGVEEAQDAVQRGRVEALQRNGLPGRRR